MDTQCVISPPQPLCSVASKMFLLQPCRRDLPQLVAVFGRCYPAAAIGSPENFPPGQLISGIFHAKGGNSAGSRVKEMEGLSSWEMGLFVYWFSAVCVLHCLIGILTL